MLTARSDSVCEIDAFPAGDAEYRVLERRVEHVFAVVRASPDEPIELLAECPYTYNREAVRVRALLLARVLRDEDAV